MSCFFGGFYHKDFGIKYLSNNINDYQPKNQFNVIYNAFKYAITN